MVFNGACIKNSFSEEYIVAAPYVKNYLWAYDNALDASSLENGLVSNRVGKVTPYQLFRVLSREDFPAVKIDYFGRPAFVGASQVKLIDFSPARVQRKEKTLIEELETKQPINKSITEELESKSALFLEENMDDLKITISRQAQSYDSSLVGFIITILIFLLGLVVNALVRYNTRKDVTYALMSEITINRDTVKYILSILDLPEFNLKQLRETQKSKIVSRVYDEVDISKLTEKEILQSVIQLYSNLKTIFADSKHVDNQDAIISELASYYFMALQCEFVLVFLKKKARIRYSADFKEYKKKGENSSLVKPAFFFQHYLDEAGLNVQKSKASLTFLERLNNIFYRFVTFLNIDSLVNVSHIDEEHLLFTKPQELNIMLKFIQGQPEQDFFIEKYTKLLELNNKIRDDFAT